MIDLKLECALLDDLESPSITTSFHPSFYSTYEKLKRWFNRFLFSHNEVFLKDLLILQVMADKRFLDHRSPTHLSRLLLSTHSMQKKLMISATFNSHRRHVATRCIPTELTFPFSSNPVIGCLVGFNSIDSCELFDEESLIATLKKLFPDLQIVQESSYRHYSQHKNLKIFYFEVGKKDGTKFSLAEHKILRNSLDEKVKNGIQKLSPTVSMNHNLEEVYRSLLILSREIHTPNDLPQVHISLDQQNRKEIIFNVILVQVRPLHPFSIKERLFGCILISEQIVPVSTLENRSIDAHILRLSLPRTTTLLKNDGSTDFYSARQKVSALLTQAVGEFRDYNGGLLIKQQELLFSLKKSLVDENDEHELIEKFFYALVPIEKQALLDPEILSKLFTYFNKERSNKPIDHFSLKVYSEENETYIVLHYHEPSLTPLVSSLIEKFSSQLKDLAYNYIDIAEGFFFNCAITHHGVENKGQFIQTLQETLEHWRGKKKSQQILRIAIEESNFTLDPRIGGDNVYSNVLRILFEGLTRVNEEGTVENGIADSIEISPDLKEYTFKLRHCLWNNGSLVSAHDFAYAWKKILSPSFKTNFAILFYPIKNAKEMKEGEVSSDLVGIHALDDQTLHVQLNHPAPYFLQLIVHPIFSPIHRLTDQECPQWPYQSGKNYPCNGPFHLNVNHPTEGYQLIKNPLYWDASHVALDQIVFSKMDPFQAVESFDAGAIDWVGNPFGPWHSVYESNRKKDAVSSRSSFTGWAVFNTNFIPFEHKKIRQAFSLAVDRTQLVENSFGHLTPSFSLLSYSQQREQNSDFPGCDIEKAHQLLQEGLSELNISKENFSFNLSYTRTGVMELIAQHLKTQFKEHLGIECQLHAFTTYPLLFKMMTEGKFHMALTHWSSLIDDPIYTLNALKFAGDGINFAKWEHPDFQHLLDLSQDTLNPFQRSSYLHQASLILSEEVPVIPLFEQPVQALMKENLSINKNNLTFFFNIAKCYYKQPHGVKSYDNTYD